MTSAQRAKLTTILAEYWADGMEMDDLLDFFIEKQEEYLNGMSDEDFLAELEENDIDLDEN